MKAISFKISDGLFFYFLLIYYLFLNFLLNRKIQKILIFKIIY